MPARIGSIASGGFGRPAGRNASFGPVVVWKPKAPVPDVDGVGIFASILKHDPGGASARFLLHRRPLGEAARPEEATELRLAADERIPVSPVLTPLDHVLLEALAGLFGPLLRQVFPLFGVGKFGATPWVLALAQLLELVTELACRIALRRIARRRT